MCARKILHYQMRSLKTNKSGRRIEAIGRKKMKRHAYIEFQEKVEKHCKEKRTDSLGTNLRKKVKSYKLIYVILGPSNLRMKSD